MMTRNHRLPVTAARLLVCLGVALSSQGADFVVEPGGSDENPGTEAKPFATLARARDAVRTFKKNGMTEDVIVHVWTGEYVLNEPVVFGPEDSGTNGFCVIYRNADALGSARFAGGERAMGWTRHEGKIWKKTGVKHLVTTLYEDGRRGNIARSPNRGTDPEYPNAMAPYFVSVGGATTRWLTATASWKPGFDRARMETDRIGLTPEFPKEYVGPSAIRRRLRPWSRRSPHRSRSLKATQRSTTRHERHFWRPSTSRRPG